MDLFTHYYRDIEKIYAICGDMGLSDEVARLLSYIHVKVGENGIEYLDGPPPVAKDALEAMTNETMVADTWVLKDGTVVSASSEYGLAINRKIAMLDAKFGAEQGMENRLSSEMRNRLRLYKDPEFRARMKTLYSDKIAPAIFTYSRENVDCSFQNYRRKKSEEEARLQAALDSMSPGP